LNNLYENSNENNTNEKIIHEKTMPTTPQSNEQMVQKLTKKYLLSRDLQKDEFLGLTTICKSEGNK